jgi:DNA-binding LacI/PurR family transcriptional regulator
MVTVKDIALRAGIHVTTVSGILNGTRGNSRASAKTEARVKQIAKEMGYVPNRAARQLRQGVTHSIGLVGGDIRNPFFADFAAQLEERLHSKGYELLISCRGDEELLDVLAKSVDGCLIWTEHSVNEEDTRNPRGAAIVHLGTGPEHTDRVNIDIAAGMQAALQWLWEKGCRSPIFFAPASADTRGLPVPRAELFRSIALEVGFQELKNAEKCIFAPCQDWNLQDALTHARSFWKKASVQADAVVAFNDVFAEAWLLAAEEQNVHLPLVSFDGTPWIAARRPTIPHVQINPAEIVQAATELLLRRLQQPDAEPGIRDISPHWIS